jgi:tight adherence protein B
MMELPFKLLSAVLLALTVGLLSRELAARRRYPGESHVTRYVEYLDHLYARCFVLGSGRATLRAQALLLLVLVLLALVLGTPWPLVLALPVLATPALRLLSVKKKRRAACDAQAGAFCLTLANLLRTIPNVSTALEASALATKAPLADELRLAFAEVALGNPIDAALLNASSRAESKGLDACVSALLVGHQVGGNLPVLLETTSATLREMDRLDGVIRSRTAEGRAQLAVLAVLPAAILIAFSLASPGYFDPLQTQWVGRLVLAGAAVLWLSALFLAKAILTVDI